MMSGRLESLRECLLGLAAICGQIGGAFYDEAGIPPGWLEKLAQAEARRSLADQLFQAGVGHG